MHTYHDIVTDGLHHATIIRAETVLWKLRYIVVVRATEKTSCAHCWPHGNFHKSKDCSAYW